MAWKIEIQPPAARELEKLGAVAAQRIVRFLNQRVANLVDPRAIGEALHGPELGDCWKYRVGDYRIVEQIDDGTVRIFFLRAGNRRDIYRR